MLSQKAEGGPSVDDAQANCDPWPYLMIDRSVEPAVSLLSTRLGVTPQHARGGLIGFWGNCVDPRDLERLHAEGKDEVVFTREEVTLRFAMAMAVDRSKVDPDELVALRLLQPTGPGEFRVRGASRYFKPLVKRLRFRAAQTAGGKARASAGRSANGRFLPVTGAGPSAGVSAGPSAGVSAGPSAGVSASSLQLTTQLATSTEVRGQRSSVKNRSVAQARPEVTRIFEHWKTSTKKAKAILDDKRERLIETRLKEGHTEADLIRAIDGYAKSEWHNGANDRHRKYLGLDLMLRDAAHVEAGLEMVNGTAAIADAGANIVRIR